MGHVYIYVQPDVEMILFLVCDTLRWCYLCSLRHWNGLVCDMWKLTDDVQIGWNWTSDATVTKHKHQAVT